MMAEPESREIPARAIVWSNIGEAVYTSDVWDEAEVLEWLDSLHEDLELASLRATPLPTGDSRIPARVREMFGAFACYGCTSSPARVIASLRGRVPWPRTPHFLLFVLTRAYISRRARTRPKNLGTLKHSLQRSSFRARERQCKERTSAASTTKSSCKTG